MRVSIVPLYLHHARRYAYFRESDKPIRSRLSGDQTEALAGAEDEAEFNSGSVRQSDAHDRRSASDVR